MIETKFKQTEIGLIPEDWEIIPLGELCKVRGRIGFRGYTTNDLVKKGEGAIAIAGKNITHNVLDLSSSDYISWSKYYESPEIMVKMGDIVLAQRGTLGRVAIIDREIGHATINPSLALLNTIKCNNQYLYYYLASNATVKSILSQSGLTSIPMISQRQIEQIEIVIPNGKEQQRIAEVLSNIDQLISSLSKIIEKKRLIKQGAMQQLLTGKKRLPGFDGEWVEMELGELLKYEQPQLYIVQDTEYLTTGIPVLTAGKTFILGYTCETNGVYEDVPIILFDDFTTASKYVNFKFKVKSSAAKILSLRDRKCNLRLIYELMQMIDFPLADHQRYWISEYSHIKIWLPDDYDEQDAIANVFTTMDNEIESLEDERDKYIRLKEGMMQKLLTGQIRLVDTAYRKH